MGDFKGALDSYDRANRAYKRVPSAQLHHAIVSYGRARSLSQSEQFDEALAALAEAEATFVAFGDVGRYVACRLEIGNTLYRRRDTEGAVKIWEAISAHADANDDQILRARVSNNLGFAYIRMGNYVAAGSSFECALSLFAALGLDTQLVLARWGFAKLSVEGGDPVRGIEAMRSCMRDFERYGMFEDAMLVSLDVADALLRIGRAPEAHRVCNSLVRHFRKVGLRSPALRAFEYLRRAAMDMSLSRQSIGYVREFVERLIANPSLRFAPPSSS
jgi:tetratricopeptide (TPR) repeat protein